VRLVPNEEQLELARSAGSLLAQLMAVDLRDPDVTHAPFDDAAWRACADMGIFGLALEPEAGGVGYGAFEEALVYREISASLPPIGLLATTVAVHVAVQAGAAELAAGLLEGSLRAGLAEAEGVGTAGLSGSELSGELVLFGPADADVLLVMVDGAAAVVAAEAFTGAEPRQSLDPVIDVGFATARSAPALALTRDPSIGTRAAILCSALLTGVAEAACDASVPYVQQRVQFGKPLGAFQAVKHRCADMATRAEVALAATLYAARLADLHDDTSAQHALAAKVVASDAAVLNAGDNVQNHGGIGFTYEGGAHLLVRRAHVLTAMLGGQAGTMHELLDGPPPLAVG